MRLAAVSLCLLLACGGGGSKPPSTDAAQDAPGSPDAAPMADAPDAAQDGAPQSDAAQDGAPQSDLAQDGAPQSDVVSTPGDIARTLVGPAGATLSSDAVVVRVPAGAVTGEVPIDVTRVVGAGLVALTAATTPTLGDADLSSDVFAFTPHGTTFSAPVEIEIVHNGQGNFVLRLDDEHDTTWEVVTGASFGGGVARFQAQGFSMYAVARAGACLAYSTCTQAMAAAKITDRCHPKVPNGCGGIMDGGTTCTEGKQCFKIPDQFSPGGGYYDCRLPCGSCPPDGSKCVDPLILEVTMSSCEPGGYCGGFVGRTRCGNNYDDDPAVNCHMGRCETPP
jgi:hypothetical protein